MRSVERPDCLPGFKSITRKNTAIYGIVIILSYKFSISQRKNSQSKNYPNKACCNPSGLFFFLLSTTFCLTSILNGYELLLGIIPLDGYYQSVCESPVRRREGKARPNSSIHTLPTSHSILASTRKGTWVWGKKHSPVSPISI